MITSESVKSAIAAQIISEYTDPTINKEKIMGSISKPCFFIMLNDIKQTQKMNGRYEWAYHMNVRYHSTETDLTTYENLTSVGTTLMQLLQYIELPVFIGIDEEGDPVENDIPVRGTQINFRITDSVLLFFVTYRITIVTNNSGPVMEGLEFNYTED